MTLVGITELRGPMSETFKLVKLIDPITVTSAGAFNDAEGDPSSVGTAVAADGTSAYAARRDHVHNLGFSAKGDVLVGSGSGTAVIKAVGSNNQVLTADSTAAGGVKWSSPSFTAATDYTTIMVFSGM